MITLNPLDTRHKEFWKLSVDCFEKAGELLECPVETVQVILTDKTLPCYFIPAKKDKECPVIFLVTGGEGSNDVDVDRIAMFGISFGGYLVARAAIFDKE